MNLLGRSAAIAALSLVAIFAAGCGETVIDDVKTEDAIEQNLKTSAGEKVTSVDCPSGVEVEAEATFDCTVNLAGGEQKTAQMKILNEDADIELANLKAGK